MIPGPKQPGDDIYVFLAPLIEDLSKLWTNGVQVWDALRNEVLIMRAPLLWTINDYPAYGNLSGCITKGYLNCVVCGEDIDYVRLTKGNKIFYQAHKRWLPAKHSFRRNTRTFNGRVERLVAPRPGASEAKKHNCIFWSLPYWHKLPIRHNLDVMHIEKNICESILGTLLNMVGKTKDEEAGREDMELMRIHRGLTPVARPNGVYLSPLSHILSKEEKINFMQLLHEVRILDGYSSNIRTKVKLDSYKLVNLKSNDHHVFVQQIITIVVRGLLNGDLREVMTRFCFFFNTFCAQVIDPFILDDLHKEIMYTLCLLEMHFPPSFFDVMVHLSVHLVREVKLCGSIYARWMYPFERFMRVLKGYVQNRNRPEASMVEAYVAEEAIDLCSDVLSYLSTIGIPERHNDSLMGGFGLLTPDVENYSRELLARAHHTVLVNNEPITPYVNRHMKILEGQVQDIGKGRRWINKEHTNPLPTGSK